MMQCSKTGIKKGLFGAVITLMAVLAAASACFAETYVIDSFTGDVISSVDGTDYSAFVDEIKISGDVYYSVSEESFVYYLSGKREQSVHINVLNGAYTTDPVVISCSGGLSVKVYRDSELVAEGSDIQINDAGAYIVRLLSNDELICSFNIIGEYCSNIYSIELPSIYKVSSVRIDGSPAYVSSLEKIDLEKEGTYDISLLNQCDSTYVSMHFTVDRTPPVLEITGLSDGEARNAVIFGDTEIGSTLDITRDGNEISPGTEYDDAGYYVVRYTDAAGNTSVYEFRIHMFLDLNSWLVLGVFAAVIIVAAVYVVYKRRHLRID